MKVIITGGTGLIGAALARKLIQEGHEVVVLTRKLPQGKVKNIPTRARFVEWDAKTSRGWAQEVEDADAIVNLAGETVSPQGGLWTAERKRRIKQSRIDAAQAVVEAVRGAQHKPRVLVQASAVGYYGTHRDELITEGAPPGTDFLGEVCQAWEAASAPVEEMGVRRVITRLGVVFSEEGGSLGLLILPFRLFVGGPVGDGKQYIPWVHIDDVVGAIQFLLTHEAARGPFNLTSPNPVTNKEFGTVAGKVLGRPSLFPTPGFMLKLALGEASTIALDGQRAIPKALQGAGYDFQFPNLEGALRELLE